MNSDYLRFIVAPSGTTDVIDLENEDDDLWFKSWRLEAKRAARKAQRAQGDRSATTHADGATITYSGSGTMIVDRNARGGYTVITE